MSTNQNTFKSLLEKSASQSILEFVPDQHLIELHMLCKSKDSAGNFYDRRKREWLPLVENEIRFRQSELKKAKENDLLKAGHGHIGEIRDWGGKKYKKQPNGKWLEVSESHGLTKEEHHYKSTRLMSDKMLTPEGSQEGSDMHHLGLKHEKIAKKLSDKEHSDEELGFGLDNGIKNLDSYKTYFFSTPKRGGVAQPQQEDLSVLLKRLDTEDTEELEQALNSGKNVILTWVNNKGSRNTRVISSKHLDLDDEVFNSKLSSLRSDAIYITATEREDVQKSEKDTLSQQDTNDLIKGGKRAQLGEKRTWGGIEYTKTHDGWQPIVSAEHHSEKAKEHHLKALDAGKKGDTKAELHHLDKHVYHSKLRDLAKQTSTVDTEKDKTPRERYEELGKKLESGEITEQEFLNEQSRLRYETGLSLAELSGEDQILVNSSESKAQELGTKYPALEDAVGLSNREWTLDKVTNITVTPKGNYSIEVNGKDSGIIIAADSLAGIQAKQMMSTDLLPSDEDGGFENGQKYHGDSEVSGSGENIQLSGEHEPTVYCLKAGSVSKKNIKDNEIIQAWGPETAFFLVDDKYIIGGSGKVQEYIGENKTMKLADDGNRTTRFPSTFVKQRSHRRGGYHSSSHIEPSKVTAYANNINDFVEQLPNKGSFVLYAMK